MPFKRKKPVEAPHRVAVKKIEEVRKIPEAEIKKLNNRELKRCAIMEGMKAVKKCHPRLTIGDIMQMEIERQLGKKTNKHVEEILEIFRNAANKFCSDQKREPLF